MMSKKFAWLLAAALALSACGPAAPAATPTPTKTLTPAVQPTEAPIDTPAPPTDTPVPTIEEPPTATATAIPATDTPAAEATQPVATDTPVAAATNPPQPSGGFASMRSPDFGAQAFLWWRGEIADRDLTLMKNSGFQWVKQWFAWDDIEAAGKGQYDWSIPDRIVQQTEEHGLKLLVRVDREPAWAGPPPQNTQHLVDFLNALATRYKGRIDAIQIWNEPNLAREWGNQPPNPAQYAQMLRASYQ
ncbi:MAG: beta-galactosidase, partial [Anaerolineae bacterium]|nr:beta-galactosidase [Anaerolineae bacterium]